MRKSPILAALLGLLAGFLLTAGPVANATYDTGNQGCTPGYWKNHPGSWQSYAGLETHDTVSSVFKTSPALAGNTLLQALSYKGGNDLLGAERILLRAGVAAWLNTEHDGVNYPYTTKQVVDWVNYAISTQSRDAMLHIAAKLDAANNGGCPL